MNSPSNYSQGCSSPLEEESSGDVSSPNAETDDECSSPSPPAKRRRGSTKRKQVKRACSNCRKAHAGCDENRPCRRCVGGGKELTCKDVPRKKRTRARIKKEKSSSSNANYTLNTSSPTKETRNGKQVTKKPRKLNDSGGSNSAPGDNKNEVNLKVSGEKRNSSYLIDNTCNTEEFQEGGHPKKIKTEANLPSDNQRTIEVKQEQQSSGDSTESVVDNAASELKKTPVVAFLQQTATGADLLSNLENFNFGDWSGSFVLGEYSGMADEDKDRTNFDFQEKLNDMIFRPSLSLTREYESDSCLAQTNGTSLGSVQISTNNDIVTHFDTLNSTGGRGGIIEDWNRETGNDLFYGWDDLFNPPPCLEA